MSLDKPSQVYPGAGTEDDPFVVSFGELDPDSPKSWSTTRKWTFMLIYATGMMSGTFAVSSYTSGFAGMIEEFGTTSEVLAVGQFTFLIGIAVGSLVWPAMGDLLGRRHMAIGTLTAFTAFSAGTAAAPNMATVLVTRFISGFFSAGIQALGPASLPALFERHEIAVPFTVSAIAPFLGPSIGPLVGGYVTQYTKNWRAINWVAVGFAGVMALLSLFVPELFAPTLLRKRAQQLSKTTGAQHVSVYDVGRKVHLKSDARAHLVKPFRYLTREPIVLLFSAYVAFLYAVLQIFFTAFPIIYVQKRGYEQGEAGLPYLALICGYAISVPLTMLCSQPYLKMLKAEGHAPPELRLIFAMLSAVSLPIALFWMGWTALPPANYMNPVVAGGIFGLGQIGITMSVFIYFTDLYQTDIAAVTACVNLLRYGCGAIFPLFTRQFYDRLGVPWACSLVAFVLLLFMPVPFVFFKFGPYIRGRSKLVKIKPVAAEPSLKEVEAGDGSATTL